MSLFLDCYFLLSSCPLVSLLPLQRRCFLELYISLGVFSSPCFLASSFLLSLFFQCYKPIGIFKLGLQSAILLERIFNLSLGFLCFLLSHVQCVFEALLLGPSRISLHILISLFFALFISLVALLPGSQTG